MKFKKICLSTSLSDLYGIDAYQSHIKVNKEYWYYFSRTIELPEGWYKLKVTYIRSGCVFYVITDHPELGENYFPLSCFMASKLIVAEIDPVKDLKNFDSDGEKKLYCFNTEHTIVHNWPNDREVELSSDDPVFLVASVLLK